MSLVEDDLRGDVLRSAAEGPGRLAAVELAREAEVCELDVARGVEQQVLWLEVAVDDAAVVEVVEGEDHAAHVEARRGVLQSEFINLDIDTTGLQMLRNPYRLSGNFLFLLAFNC